MVGQGQSWEHSQVISLPYKVTVRQKCSSKTQILRNGNKMSKEALYLMERLQGTPLHSHLTKNKLKVLVKRQNVDFWIEHRQCGIVLLNEGSMLQTEEEIEKHLIPLAKFSNALVLLYLSPLTSSAYADIQLNLVLKHGYTTLPVSNDEEICKILSRQLKMEALRPLVSVERLPPPSDDAILKTVTKVNSLSDVRAKKVIEQLPSIYSLANAGPHLLEPCIGGGPAREVYNFFHDDFASHS